MIIDLTPARSKTGPARLPDMVEAWGCCGFAGDRGMLHPELAESATKDEAAEIHARGTDTFASLNRTCEVGMTRATGEEYVHILELVEQATRLKSFN